MKLNIPRGSNYELCRSVHAEANSIISACRRDMLGATLYLVGKEIESSNLVENANPCTMCKRMIINAGISEVIIRETSEKFRNIDVDEWINYDDTLEGKIGY